MITFCSKPTSWCDPRVKLRTPGSGDRVVVQSDACAPSCSVLRFQLAERANPLDRALIIRFALALKPGLHVPEVGHPPLHVGAFRIDTILIHAIPIPVIRVAAEASKPNRAPIRSDIPRAVDNARAGTSFNFPPGSQRAASKFSFAWMGRFSTVRSSPVLPFVLCSERRKAGTRGAQPTNPVTMFEAGGRHRYKRGTDRARWFRRLFPRKDTA